MSKPREKWWGYVKACIREYPAIYQALEAARAEAVAPENHRARPTEWEALIHIEGIFPDDSNILSGQRAREFYGVRNAIIKTARLQDGPERLKLIETVFWKRSHTLAGAAALCNVSERTARRWHGDFIRLTARCMNLSD